MHKGFRPMLRKIGRFSGDEITLKTTPEWWYALSDEEWFDRIWEEILKA